MLARVLAYILTGMLFACPCVTLVPFIAVDIVARGVYDRG